eukprot:sb/3464148/
MPTEAYLKIKWHEAPITYPGKASRMMEIHGHPHCGFYSPPLYWKIIHHNNTELHFRKMAKDPAPVIVLPNNNNNATNHVAVPLERLDSDLSTMSLGETEKNRFGAFANVALSWENLNVSATVDTSTGMPCCRKGEKVKKQILSEVSGICKPGTFMAIMGARQHHVPSGVFLERREGCLKCQTKLKTVITFVMTFRFLCPSFNTRYTTRSPDSQSFMVIALKLWPLLFTQKGGTIKVVRDPKNGHFVSRQHELPSGKEGWLGGGRIGPRALASAMIFILTNESSLCYGEICVKLIPPCGAGKTTLLNTLARKNAVSLSESGSIRMNGVDATRKKMMHLSAYVQQEDYFIATMTVKEVLMFHAILRMGSTTPYGEKKRIVKKILNELGLTKVENTLCGAPAGLIRGISGGERKRLSVACELLMNPPLLFIDEPTSGLDSFMAQSIVRLIGKLAKANRTILCTIHQPTSEVFAMFDHGCVGCCWYICCVGWCCCS